MMNGDKKDKAEPATTIEATTTETTRLEQSAETEKQTSPSKGEWIDLPLDGVQDKGVVPDNTVVAILQDVEINYETPLQLKQICLALNDMATLPVSEIRKKRYADFNGKQGQWTLLQVLYAYFLPAQKFNLQNFYEDIEKPLSREIVRETLKDMQEYCTSNDSTGENNTANGW